MKYNLNVWNEYQNVFYTKILILRITTYLLTFVIDTAEFSNTSRQ